MTVTIRGVDVSSHQSLSWASLTEWIAQHCQVLFIHAYTTTETPGLDAATRSWAAMARSAGVWHLPYLFLFSSADPAEQVQSALDTWRSAGEEPRLLAIDCEEYQDDPGPAVGQILSAVDECHRQGVSAIGYSRAGWLGDRQELSVIPWWLAQYDGRPNLVVAAPAWCQIVGKQYTSKPVDWSCWDLVELQRLAAGYVALDPCATLRAGVQAVLADLDALRGRLAALLS